VSLALTSWLALVASDEAVAPVLVLGLTGAAATVAALVWPVVLGAALALSAAAYAALLAVDEPPLDGRAAGVAAALVAVGEFVGWSRELASTSTDEPGGAWRRPTWIAAVAIGSLLVGWALLAVVDLARVEGLAVEAVGATCALAALVVAWRLARTTSGRVSD
jgi:hypothetical protein